MSEKQNVSVEVVPESGLAVLRVPFPANLVNQLPKPVKSKDDDKGRCEPGTGYSVDGVFCGGWHARSIHLDYVGHAALTHRLLDADPAWSWEPLAFGPDGLPVFDEFGGLWIRLTVCGVTRFGYGDAQGKNGGNAVKEAIGDALRNAGMRFGAALDLWHKGDLFEVEQEQGKVAAEEPAKPKRSSRVKPPVAQPRQEPVGGKTEPTRDWLGMADACTTVEELRAVFEAAKDLGELGLKVSGGDETVNQFLRNRKQFLAEEPPAPVEADVWAKPEPEPSEWTVAPVGVEGGEQS